MLQFEPFTPPDCSGVCLPDPAGNTVDILRAISARNCAARIRALVEATTSTPDEQRLLKTIAATLDTLDPLALSTVFDPLPAFADAPLPGGIDDATSDSRPAAAHALGAARYLIGASAISSLTLVLPPSVIPTAGLYLPHLRAMLLPPGPVAVITQAGLTRFTWPDGAAITLAVGNPEVLEPLRDHRLVTLPRVEDFPVFNAATEIAQCSHAFGLCDIRELPASLSLIAAGFAALRSIWPDASGSMARHLKGLLILARRNHSRSHSPTLFPGMVLLSPEDPITAGDLLVHELSHIRLNLFREFDKLFTDREPERRHLSPWRLDPRPLAGLVLGVHAFLNICHYYRRVGGSAASIFERQRDKVRMGWNTAKPYIVPTRLGCEFFTILEKEVMAL